MELARSNGNRTTSRVPGELMLAQAAKVLVERCRLPEVRESFYAITPSRRFLDPLVREILAPGARGAGK
jgi:hypothetical protein